MIIALFWLVILLAFVFGMTNGFIDGGGLVSTVITTRVLDPLPALLLVAGAEILGLFLLGQQVADTLGRHMTRIPVDAPAGQVLSVLIAALAGALVWNMAMWRLALPSSSSHALVGGLVGAFSSQYGWAGIEWAVFLQVFLFLGLVPLFGLVLGFFLTRFHYWAGEFLTPAVTHVFHALQILALTGIAMVHGSNDGQKSMGMILLALLGLQAVNPHAPLPWFVFFICGSALALGVIFGSRRMIRTMGKNLYRIQELQSFSAQASTLLLMGASSLAGYPMSTTHVMSASVLGAGAAVRPRAVRWDLARDIVVVWCLTIPATAAIAALIRSLFRVVP